MKVKNQGTLKEVRELRKWNGTSLDYIGELYAKSPNLYDITEEDVSTVAEVQAITKPTKTRANVYNWLTSKIGQPAVFGTKCNSIVIPCGKGSSYTIKYFGTITTARLCWSECDSDVNILKQKVAFANGSTITTTEDACVYLFIEWSTDDADVSQIVIVKGTQVPQEHHPFGIDHIFSAGFDKAVSGTTSLSCPDARPTWMTFGVQGNTSQASTPTPSAPVDVKGVGDMTANVFDMHYDVGYSGSYPNITPIAGGKSTEWLNTEDFGTYFYWVWNVNTKNTGCVMGVVYSNDKSEILYRDGLYNARALSGAVYTDIPGGGGNPFFIKHEYTYVKFYVINWVYTNRLGIYKTSQSTFVPYGAQIPVTSGVTCGAVDLGTLTWTYVSPTTSAPHGYFACYNVPSKKTSSTNQYLYGYGHNTTGSVDKSVWGNNSYSLVCITDFRFTDAASFKAAMSGKYLYYQRTTDSSWTAPITTNLYLEEPLHKLSTYVDNLNGKTLTRNIGVKVLDGTEDWNSYTYSGVYSFYLILSDMIDTTPSTSSDYFKCSHFTYHSTVWGSAENIGFAVSTLKRMFFRRNNTDDLAAWKAWLAEQYAAGTPVTIYYPLATPATETVDVEKPKTLRGDNTVTIGTEVQPSALSAVYKSYTR